MRTNITIWLLAVLAVFVLSNHALIMVIHSQLKSVNAVSNVKADRTVAQAPASVTDEKVKEIYSQVIPAGVPDRYGAELGVSFDQAAAAIPILSRFEQDTRPQKLTGDKLARYINIGQQTACEYCCGAKTMVFKDGRKACGCAHSAAMRGVVAYLLDNYPEMSDEDILAEANRWKAVFFPRQTVQKALSVSANGEVDIKALNTISQQVGGC
jgi:hypothetical protein